MLDAKNMGEKEVLALLGEVFFWEKHSSGYLLHFSGHNTQLVTFEDVAAMDSRLPGFLAIAEDEKSTWFGRLGVAAMTVEQTYKLWHGKAYKLQTNTKETVVVVRVDNLRITGDEVVIYGTFYGYDTYFDSVANMRLSRTTGRQYENVTTSTNWLDENYPGWRNRWQVTESLALTSSETTDHLFDMLCAPRSNSSALPEGLDL